jgi:hypothetical protein
MYPQTYLSLFPPFPRLPKAFVAMSFDSAFTPRWTNVLQPALRDVEVGGVKLSPLRVDLSKAGDAILTEILQGIAESTVVVADITTVGSIGERTVRNANVLYEVGIAHASRRPEEVILFRSDNYALDFDVQGVRVHHYNPDADPTTAQTFVTEVVVESLRSLTQARRVALRLAAQRLTVNAYSLLLEARDRGAIQHPRSNTMGAVISGIHRSEAITLLLELGALEANLFRVTSDLLDRAEQNPDLEVPWLDYRLSAFGNALADFVLDEALPKESHLIARMNNIFGGASPSPGSCER